MNSINKEKINHLLSPKVADARVAQIFNTFDNVLVTSSFGATSVVLLHIISRIKPNHPIYFIDTGYHFKETLSYKNALARLLNINVIDIKPNGYLHQKTNVQQMWKQNPDRCCEINKVKPLKEIKGKHSVWVAGLIGFQNHRRNFEVVEDKAEILKFYPLIDWNSSLVEEYMEVHNLPPHPLKKKGYHSIGCTHCTMPGLGRNGRWKNKQKTECGLHL